MRSSLLLLSRQNQISDRLRKAKHKIIYTIFFFCLNNLRFSHWSSTFYALQRTTCDQNFF